MRLSLNVGLYKASASLSTFTGSQSALGSPTLSLSLPLRRSLLGRVPAEARRATWISNLRFHILLALGSRVNA